MIKIFSVAEMVAAEKAADASGVTYDQMMEKAGKAVADAIIQRTPVASKRITVLVGPGNNGGDGLVAGRYLAHAGADVTFYLYRTQDPKNDINLAKVQEMDLLILAAEYDKGYRVLRNRLNITDILIDSLLGTGVSRPIEGVFGDLMKQVQLGLKRRTEQFHVEREPELFSISQLDSARTRSDIIQGMAPPVDNREIVVVAVDCPSGLNCDNGNIDALAVPADLTVTFAGPKRGHFIFPGAGACGELVIADIGISPDLDEVSAVRLELATRSRVRRSLPSRPIDGHKGTFGWVMIAAGSSRYWGAPGLTGKAAYRTGSGLVALAVPSTVRSATAVMLPEATYPLISDGDNLGAAGAEEILNIISSYQAMLIGPGLHDAMEFITGLFRLELRPSLPPLIVDADGLNLLAEIPDWPRLLPEGTILTPHPGELARLMGVDLKQVKEQDRVMLARDKAADWGCVLLLKGAFSVIAAHDGRCALLPFANPALATAGSGDVLSGIIVSLLGQGVDPFEAALLGGYLHGATAVTLEKTEGLLAGEIADGIPEVLRALRQPR